MLIVLLLIQYFNSNLLNFSLMPHFIFENSRGIVKCLILFFEHIVFHQLAVAQTGGVALLLQPVGGALG